MKLKAKLLWLVGAPLAGLALTIIAVCWSANGLQKSVHVATTENVVSANLARELKLHVVQVQQYLSDISATRGLDGLDDGFAKAAEERDAFLGGLKLFQTMFRENHNAKAAKELEALGADFEAYYQTGVTMSQAYVKDGPAAGNRLMAAFDATAAKLTQTLDTFVGEQSEALTTSLEQIERFSRRTAISILVGGIVLAIVTFGLTLTAVRALIKTIQGIATQVSENAANVTASTTELSAASQTVAEGASEQAASLEETSASLEEIASMTKRNAENATNAADLGRESRDSAHAGLARIEELSQTLHSIKAAVAEMQTAVTEAQASSREISKIIKTIDEIAFQTNLLALNAAVEAARAGEAGMGFAVVADEVRALAQRSAQAAKDTADKIEAAIKRNELGGSASAKVVKRLGEVETTAQSIQQVFSGIVTQIKSLDEVIAEIAAASKEQSQGVGEVNVAVGQMDKITQSNAAAAEENAGAAQELNNQSRNLKSVIAQLEQIVRGGAAGSDSALSLTLAAPIKTKRAIPPAKPATVRTASGDSARATDRDIPMPPLVSVGEANGGFKDF